MSTSRRRSGEPSCDLISVVPTEPGGSIANSKYPSRSSRNSVVTYNDNALSQASLHRSVPSALQSGSSIPIKPDSSNKSRHGRGSKQKREVPVLSLEDQKEWVSPASTEKSPKSKQSKNQVSLASKRELNHHDDSSFSMSADVRIPINITHESIQLRFLEDAKQVQNTASKVDILNMDEDSAEPLSKQFAHDAMSVDLSAEFVEDNTPIPQDQVRDLSNDSMKIDVSEDSSPATKSKKKLRHSRKSKKKIDYREDSVSQDPVGTSSPKKNAQRKTKEMVENEKKKKKKEMREVLKPRKTSEKQQKRENKKRKRSDSTSQLTEKTKNVVMGIGEFGASEDQDDDIVWEEENLPPSSHRAVEDHSGEFDISLSNDDNEENDETGASKTKSKSKEKNAEAPPTKKRRVTAPTRISKEEKQFWLNRHRLHLLLLMNVGLRGSRQCEDAALQALLYSLLPQELIQEAARFRSIPSDPPISTDRSRIQYVLDYDDEGRRYNRRISSHSPKTSTVDISIFSPFPKDESLDPKSREFIHLIQHIQNWLHSTVPVISEEESGIVEKIELPRLSLQYRKSSPDSHAKLLCATIRSLGFRCRLVLDLRPFHFNPSAPPTPTKLIRTTPHRPPISIKSEEGKESTNSKKRSRSASLSANAQSTNNPPVMLTPPFRPQYGFWVEVYSKATHRWIPVPVSGEDIPFGVAQGQNLPLPVLQRTYVISFEKLSKVEDVTPRYTAKWSLSAKQRPRDTWIESTIKYINSSHKAIVIPADDDDNMSDQEEELSEATQTDRNALMEAREDEEVPTTLSAFHNHPVYVLGKHVGKYQVIYPTDTPPVAYFKDEPVYLRRNLVLVHTAERWLQEARQILPDVKRLQRKKHIHPRHKNRTPEDLAMLGIDVDEEGRIIGVSDYYGYWQTTDYDPGEVVVPRNQYGNVSLYLPKMLPRGCAHLKIDNATRVARKLGIDCAPAMVGWEPGRHPRPVLDGVVISEEHVETLKAACLQDLIDRAKKEVEERRYTALKNWARLYRALKVHSSVMASAASGTSTTVIAVKNPLRRPQALSKSKKSKKEPANPSPTSTTKKKEVKSKSKKTREDNLELDPRNDPNHVHEFTISKINKKSGVTTHSCACGMKMVSEIL